MAVVSATIETRTRAATVPAALAELDRQLASISSADVHPTEARAVVARLASLRNQIDALDVEVIGSVDRSGQWQIDGSRSVNAWVRTVSESTRASASNRLHAARISESAPELATTFRAGKTSLDHVTVVARAASASQAREESLPEADGIFARLASRTTPDHLKRAVDRWADLIDAQAATEEFSKRAEKANLHVSTTMDRMVRVQGLLDAETGAAFLAALDATRDKLYRTRNEAGESAPNARAAGRLVSQQNVDALRQLLNLATAHPDMATGTGGVPVHIAVTTTLEALKIDLAAATDSHGTAATASEADGKLTDPYGGKPPVLSGAGDCVGIGVQIPAATARRLACDAEILPIVMNSRSQILDVGRRTRVISSALRLAIELRDEHCRFPRCDAPIQEIHHLIFWANGGPTNQSNLAGLCRHHHHTVHERGFTLTGDANHDLILTPP